jgi:steroid 5-alpha reductase family enzyme
VCWGARLSFNFWRKGGWKEEDQRWGVMRKKWGGIKMELLLFFFISYYQPFVILWFTLPAYYVSSKDLGVIDYGLLFIGILLLLLEKIADDEQYEYQTKKRI